MAWSEIVTFVFVATLLVMSPGPIGILIAKTVPTSGRAAGFANVAGFVTGFYCMARCQSLASRSFWFNPPRPL